MSLTDRAEIEALSQEVEQTARYARNTSQPLGENGWSSADHIAEAITQQTRALLLLVEQVQRIANAVEEATV